MVSLLMLGSSPMILWIVLPLYQFGLSRAAALTQNAQLSLGQEALLNILDRSSPISGVDKGCSPNAKTCNWMAKIPDSTRLVHMNLPGTHDTSTWNYSDATQASLLRYTGPISPAEAFRCQEASILQSLNDGVRVFDLRVAYNPGNDTIGLHHAQALLSPTTRLEDLFFGIYNWLDKHRTEAVLVSINHESGTGTPEDPAFYIKLYNILSSPLSQRYWVQTNGTLGTLGEARGKLTLLQRFSYNLLPLNYTKRMGIPLDPGHWTDNGKAIELTYNVAKSQVAFIEDFYNLSTDLPLGTALATYIEAKFDAITRHLTNATRSDLNPDQLYISFASTAFIDDSPPVTPKIFALGNGTIPGINVRLLPFLKAQKGKRIGIIMFDFYDAIPGLIEAAIGI